MGTVLHNQRGSALVAALFFITALSLTATVIVWVTGSERRVTHNEYTHLRSFYSSDAGAEQALNWMRLLPDIPPVVEVDGETGDQFVVREDDYTNMTSDHQHRAEIKHKLTPDGQMRVSHRPGYSNAWTDIEYIVDSFGASVKGSSTRIEVQAARLFRTDISY